MPTQEVRRRAIENFRNHLDEFGFRSEVVKRQIIRRGVQTTATCLSIWSPNGGPAVDFGFSIHNLPNSEHGSFIEFKVWALLGGYSITLYPNNPLWSATDLSEELMGLINLINQAHGWMGAHSEPNNLEPLLAERDALIKKNYGLILSITDLCSGSAHLTMSGRGQIEQIRQIIEFLSIPPAISKAKGETLWDRLTREE